MYLLDIFCIVYARHTYNVNINYQSLRKKDVYVLEFGCHRKNEYLVVPAVPTSL